MTGQDGHGGRRVAALGVAVALALSLVGCGDSDDDRGDGGRDEGTAETRPEHPEQWDERVAPIAEWVAEERGLEFEHPVEVSFLSEDEYTEDTDGETEEERQDAEDTVDLLRALGLVTGEVDLDTAADDLAGEGTLAFYSAEQEAVFVKGEELTPAVRVTVAHELTHVLQDQHFDIDRYAPEDSDDDASSEQAAGLRAVVEGDAGRIESEYAESELSAEEREEHQAESEEEAASGEEGVAEVPPALVALFGAPYALGETYVAALEENAEVDAALEEPPTEQELFDPAVRDTARAEDVEVEAPAVPEGAEAVDEDTFGPLTWYLVLASRGDPADALAVVDGWGGDAFASYRQDDRLCIDIVVTGDDAEATAAFQRALDAWAAQHPGGSATVEATDDAVTLRSCDPGEGAEAVGEVGADVLALPVTRTQIEAEVLSAYEATPEQARCASEAVVEAVPLEQLTGAEADEGTSATIRATIERCLT